MYRKALIALACAVISAPAFAQTLPRCPDGLTYPHYNQKPCTYLTPPSPPTSTPIIKYTPPENFGLDTRPGYEKYGYGQNPKRPTSDIGKGWECNHPTYGGNTVGWKRCC
jgi:hypothetical protein